VNINNKHIVAMADLLVECLQFSLHMVDKAGTAEEQEKLRGMAQKAQTALTGIKTNVTQESTDEADTHYRGG
jgi:hypothetical protein